MHEIRRWLAALLLCPLVAAASPAALADEPSDTDADAYILQAEMALQREDYLLAAREYRKAAEFSDDPNVAARATRLCMRYGFDREALVAARRWFELEDDSDEARAFIAQLSFRTGDIKAARRYFAYLIEKSQEPPGEKLLLLSQYLYDQGDAEKADALMRSLARPYPDSALAHFAVARMALRAGDTEHALERVQKSLELNPGAMESRLLYGRILLAAGDVDEAIDYTARIVGDDPDPDPDARMELAIMYMMAERPDYALSQVNQVLLEQSGRTDALRLMAIINFHQGNLDAAWDDFHDLLASGEFEVDALFYLGRIAHFRSEMDRAIRFYSEVRSGANALEAQQRAAALLAHEKDDLDGALDLLDRFAQASPSNAVAVLSAKGQLLASVEKYDEALKLYEKSVTFRPADERVALGRADVLLRMDRLDDALAAYDDIVRRWPKSATALNAYGYVLADRTDRYRKAEKLIRKALRYDPDNYAIIDSMGWVLFRLGHFEEALVELERAYAGMPDPEVAKHIVEALVALERRDEALERLAAAEARTPGSPMLEEVRSRLFGDAP